MNTIIRASRLGPFLTAATVLILLGGLFLLSQLRNGVQPVESVVADQARRARLTEEMRLLLAKSAESGKSAVLSNDDAITRQCIDRARQEVAVLEKNRQELWSLIQTKGNPQERTLAKEFDVAWAEYRTLDEKLWDLALAASNAKAAALSRNKAQPAMDAMLLALDRTAEAEGGSAKALEVLRQVSAAKTAGLRILVLHAQHIAEESDPAMDRMEARMREDGGIVLAALESLKGLALDTSALAQAGQAFAEFSATTATIIELSRENSSPKAMALAFGKHRKVHALCEDALVALKDAILQEAFKATR